MKRFIVLLLSLLLVFGTFACGNSDDDDDTNDSGSVETETETGTITGSVSGTTVIALNEDGVIVASDDTADREYDLDLDSDGTNDAFSFTLTEIPIDLNVRIYLVTGDGVFPMYFDDSGSDANVFSLSSGADIDLGYVTVAPDEGVATPANNPLDNADVTSGGTGTTDITISGATIDDFVGTWEGTLSYTLGDPAGSDYESGDIDITLTLAVSGDSLVGTFADDETDFDITGTVVNGYFIFDLPSSDPTNSDCDDWDVSCTTILDASLEEMDINSSGTFCGSDGGKPGTFKGTLFKTSDFSYDLSGNWVFTVGDLIQMNNITEIDLGGDYMGLDTSGAIVMEPDGQYPTMDTEEDLDGDGETNDPFNFTLNDGGQCAVYIEADNTGGTIGAIEYVNDMIWPDEFYGDGIIDSIIIEGDQITISDATGLSFEGTLDDDAGTINGTCNKGEETVVFTATKSD